METLTRGGTVFLNFLDEKETGGNDGWVVSTSGISFKIEIDNVSSLLALDFAVHSFTDSIALRYDMKWIPYHAKT